MSKTTFAKAGLAGLVMGTALFFALRAQMPHPIEIGDRAPEFTLPALTSQSVRLRDYRNRVLVLNFWATWCPPCVEETPSLEGFAERVRPAGIDVIGVSVDQDEPILRKFVADHRIAYPILRDPGQVIASSYGTNKFPETYILDRDGRVAEKIIGAINWQDPRIIRFVEALGSHPR